jgi:hypothetical protein
MRATARKPIDPAFLPSPDAPRISDERAIRADERRQCAVVVADYARVAGEDGVGPCSAAAEALRIGASLLERDRKAPAAYDSVQFPHHIER